MISLLQIFIFLGTVNFSLALPAYLPVHNSTSLACQSTPTTFTTFMPTIFPSMPVPHNTSISATRETVSTSINSGPCHNRTFTLAPTLATTRGILIVTTTIERHHFVEVAPVTVTSVEKMTETLMQKVTETKMVTVTASGGMERVITVVTVTESGPTGIEKTMESSMKLLPPPSTVSTSIPVISTMTTIAVITTDVTSVVTAILTHPSSDDSDASSSAATSTTAPELTSGAESAPVLTKTEVTAVTPTTTVEPAPSLTTAPEPTKEVDSGLRSSTLLRISITRLAPPAGPASASIAPVVTEVPVITPGPIVMGGDSGTSTNIPDWDDIKGFTKTFVGTA